MAHELHQSVLTLLMKTRILCFVVIAGAALAQEPAPLKLTLKDAVDLALKQNPQVILANLNVSQSQQDRLGGPLRPAAAGRRQRHPKPSTASICRPPSGSPFPGFPQHVGPYEVFQAGVGINAPVFDLTLWRRYRSSQLGIDAGRAQETTAREESVMLVVSQYLGSQRAAADVQAAQSRVDLAQALYDQAADLQKNGVGTGIDTLRANVELQNEKQRLIVATTQLETSLFGLARLLNVDPHRKLELADQVGLLRYSGNRLSIRPWSALTRTRPELRQLAGARSSAPRWSQKYAADQRLPKLSFSG